MTRIASRPNGEMLPPSGLTRGPTAERVPFVESAVHIPYIKPVKQDRSKFGTDPRYPNWSGAVLDPRFINAGMTIALLVNLTAIGLVHYDKLQTHSPFWQTSAPWRFLLALLVCAATLLLIRHQDRVVQWGARAFACGLPLVLNGLLVLQRLPLIGQ